MILRATRRFVKVFSARKTEPYAPCPHSQRSVYEPSVSPTLQHGGAAVFRDVELIDGYAENERNLFGVAVLKTVHFESLPGLFIDAAAEFVFRLFEGGLAPLFEENFIEGIGRIGEFRIDIFLFLRFADLIDDAGMYDSCEPGAEFDFAFAVDERGAAAEELEHDGLDEVAAFGVVESCSFPGGADDGRITAVKLVPGDFVAVLHAFKQSFLCRRIIHNAVIYTLM